jgi:hypothetical protein
MHRLERGKEEKKEKSARVWVFPVRWKLLSPSFSLFLMDEDGDGGGRRGAQ